MRDPRVVLITGASSGIGEALALEYAGRGVFLALGGRNAARLAGVGERCQAKGAEVETSVLDVTDANAMELWIAGLAARRPLDLVIANAGIGAGSGSGGESESQARHVFSVNLGGVLNTVFPAIKAMTAQTDTKDGQRGQIAVMSSLAGFRGYPGAPAYCASKAAIKVHGEALRGELDSQGIAVTVICPGWVRSRMTEKNRFLTPLLMDSQRAARIIRRGLARNRARIAFPRRMYFLAWLTATLPPGLIDPLLRRLPKKSAQGEDAE
jgi:short-subunit dehydrogenase